MSQDITPLPHNKSSKSLDAVNFLASQDFKKLDRFAGFRTGFLLSDVGVLDTGCPCVPLATRGRDGDLEIYCPKCGKVFRESDDSSGERP